MFPSCPTLFPSLLLPPVALVFSATTESKVDCTTHDDGSTTSQAPDWMEMNVAGGFRVWQLMFLALAGLLCLVVLMCCVMKCRIPRTKQEIEADFIRRGITRKFRSHLNKLPIDDINLKSALDKVKQLCEEGFDSDGKPLVDGGKQTILRKIRNLLKIKKRDRSTTPTKEPLPDDAEDNEDKKEETPEK